MPLFIYFDASKLSVKHQRRNEIESIVCEFSSALKFHGAVRGEDSRAQSCDDGLV